MNWTLVLSRQTELGVQAWEAIHTIAQVVANKTFEECPPARHLTHSYEEAILYGYLAFALEDVEWARRAVQCLNGAIDRAHADYLGLFGGLTGLGWTVEHISHLLRQVPGALGESDTQSLPNHYEDQEEDLSADIDAAVLKRVPYYASSSSPYDLVGGLVGFGTYFLERLPRPSAIQGIRIVFDQLERLAERTDGKATWYSGTELLPDWQRERFPNGYYNLGVAHGIPGIIHFLGEVSATDIVDRERSSQLLDGAVNWLLAQERPVGSRSRFSSYVSPGKESIDCRMAWCYGDLGILSVLLQVARQTGRRDWRNAVDELLSHCLAWPPDQTGIVDAPLCHGAAGVAHIFNRIYQTEGDSRCLNAALLWYERTMAFRRTGTGIGGFSSLTRRDRSGPYTWEASPAFLDGSIGVALAFLAAVTPVEPAWDRLLLLSGKGRRQGTPNE